MSRANSKRTDKHQKHLKVYFQQYLYNANEPHDYRSIGLPTDLDVELLESSEPMRQGYRLHERQMRTR